MKLNASYLSAALLFSLALIVHATPSSDNKKLSLPELLKPMNQNSRHRFSMSALQYTLSGTTADSINTIRLCKATDATCTTCNTNYTIITSNTPIPYATGC